MHAATSIPRRFRRTALVGLIAIATLGAVACGGDDADEPETTATTEPTAAATGDAEMTAEPTEAADAEATPPATDSGTVTIAGTTYEVSGDDFQICETVNPAFANAFNVVVDLPDRDQALLVNGDLEDMDPELDGVFLRDGETFLSEQATGAEISRDGRVLSGSATLEEGTVEFSFEC